MSVRNTVLGLVLVLVIILATVDASVIWCGNFNGNWRSSWGDVVGLHEDPVTTQLDKELGTNVLTVEFKKGQLGGDDGLTFTARPPVLNSLPKKSKMCIKYKLKFDSGFNFNLGGKLPGLAGYTPAIYPGVAKGSDKSACVGGNYKSTCFSTRFMWRPQGDGTVYAYIPPIDANRCVKPLIVCNPDKGKDLGRGAWRFVPGKWHTIYQEVTLNSIGKKDGAVKVWFDNNVIGKPTYTFDNANFRTNKDVTITHVMVHSFFGGDSSEWVSPKTQKAHFAEFVIADSCNELVGVQHRCPTTSAAAHEGQTEEYESQQSQQQQQVQQSQQQSQIYLSIGVGIAAVFIVVIIVIVVLIYRRSHSKMETV